MKLVIFGLTISSSWGNGHATLWRALCGALSRRGHHVVFFERDVPYYAEHRDLHELAGGALVLYSEFSQVSARARAELADADAALVTSFCPDALAATELLLQSRVGVRAFYDLDTPVTLAQLHERGSVPYIGPRGLQDFDLVLSFTGGRALTLLSSTLGARHVVPLYGSVDPAVHTQARSARDHRCDLSYLGTYAADRQAALQRLLLEPARCAPQRTFLLGGAQYPGDFPWTDNLYFVRHVPPAEHPAFYAASRLTLNITREPMARLGFCPSGRLFEAAACGVPIISDDWEGLSCFFTPESQLLVAHDARDVLEALQRSDAELARIAQAARARALAEHTADARAEQLQSALQASFDGLVDRASRAPDAGEDAHTPLEA